MSGAGHKGNKFTNSQRLFTMKKNLFISAALLFIGNWATAQEYKTKIPNAPGQSIAIELPANGVKIEGYSGDELIIKGSGDMKPVPDRAKGLKPVYYGAVDNTGIGLSAVKEGNVLKIEKSTRQDFKYTFRIPNKVSVQFQQSAFQGNDDLDIQGFEGDIEIKTNQAGVKADKIGGAFVANTISGNIEARFTPLPAGKTVAISSISGDIDIALQANTKASLTLKAIDGEIYTDFDIRQKGPEKNTGSLKKISVGSSLDGTINGGGETVVNLNVISGDIFLRKSQR